MRLFGFFFLYGWVNLRFRVRVVWGLVFRISVFFILLIIIIVIVILRF